MQGCPDSSSSCAASYAPAPAPRSCPAIPTPRPLAPMLAGPNTLELPSLQVLAARGSHSPGSVPGDSELEGRCGRLVVLLWARDPVVWNRVLEGCIAAPGTATVISNGSPASWARIAGEDRSLDSRKPLKTNDTLDQAIMTAVTRNMYAVNGIYLQKVEATNVR